MNIFFLDENPEIAASFLCLKHKNKMILESCQLLYGAHWALDEKPCGPNNNPYRACFLNHPCAKWVRSSASNYSWLSRHAMALCRLYTASGGKIHAAECHARWLNENVPKRLIGAAMTPPALAIKSPAYDFCLVLGNPVETYRNYYYHDKKRFAKWNGEKPFWWKERENNELAGLVKRAISTKIK